MSCDDDVEIAEIGISSTNEVILTGLRNKRTGLYPVDAIVTLIGLYDSTDTLVSGTANISMPYVGGVGKFAQYIGIIPHTITLVAADYKAKVRAVSAGNVRNYPPLPCVAV